MSAGLVVNGHNAPHPVALLPAGHQAAEEPAPAPPAAVDIPARKPTAEERAEFDRLVQESARSVMKLLRDGHEPEPHPPQELQDRLLEAHRARQTMAKFDHEAALCREQGGGMPPSFWVAFGNAIASVRHAERAVREARARRR